MFHNLCIFQNSHGMFIHYIFKLWTSLQVLSNDWFPAIHVGMEAFNIRPSFKLVKNNDWNYIRCRKV